MPVDQRQGIPDFSQIERAISDCDSNLHQMFIQDCLLDSLEELFLQAYEGNHQTLIIALLDTSLSTKIYQDFTLTIDPPSRGNLDTHLLPNVQIHTRYLYTFMLATAYKNNDLELIKTIMESYYKPELSHEIQRILIAMGKTKAEPSLEAERMLSPFSVPSPAYVSNSFIKTAVELTNIETVTRRHLPDFIPNFFGVYLQKLADYAIDDSPKVLNLLLNTPSLEMYYKTTNQNFIFKNTLLASNLSPYIFLCTCSNEATDIPEQILLQDSITSHQNLVDIVHLLIEYDIEFENYAGLILLAAIRTENAEAVRELLLIEEIKKIAHESYFSRLYPTPEKPINTAIRKKHIPIIKMLIEINMIQVTLLADNETLALIYESENSEIIKIFLEIEAIYIEYTNKLTETLIWAARSQQNEVPKAVFSKFALLAAFTTKNINLIKKLLPSDPKLSYITPNDWKYIINIGLENNLFQEQQDLIPYFIEHSNTEQKDKLQSIPFSISKYFSKCLGGIYKPSPEKTVITASKTSSMIFSFWSSLSRIQTTYTFTIEFGSLPLFLTLAKQLKYAAIDRAFFQKEAWLATVKLPPCVKYKTLSLKTSWEKHEFLFLSSEDDGTHIKKLADMIQKGLKPSTKIQWGVYHYITPLQVTLEMTHNTAFDYLIKRQYFKELPLSEKLDALQTAIIFKVHESFTHMLDDLLACLSAEDVFQLLGSCKLFEAVHSHSAPKYKERTYNVLLKLIHHIVKEIKRDTRIYDRICFNCQWTVNIVYLFLLRDSVSDDYKTIIGQILKLCADFKKDGLKSNYTTLFFYQLCTHKPIAEKLKEIKKTTDFYTTIRSLPAFPKHTNPKISEFWDKAKTKDAIRFPIKKLFSI